ncbi:hypothetical protein D6745_05045 [Candidatus Woesearchaeota archaeon]|nr:MAG: hypothetical protein D6745_05045 [Candidatus Woesearchaeota archaeon]
MKPIKVLEYNIIKSFQMVKSDIAKLQAEISSLSSTLSSWSDTINSVLEQQKEFIDEIDELKRQISKLKAQQRSTINGLAAREKKYVSSVNSKKLHRADCVFAKNIKEDKKLFFSSRTQGLRKGLEPCKCIIT